MRMRAIYDFMSMFCVIVACISAAEGEYEMVTPYWVMGIWLTVQSIYSLLKEKKETP